MAQRFRTGDHLQIRPAYVPLVGNVLPATTEVVAVEAQVYVLKVPADFGGVWAIHVDDLGLYVSSEVAEDLYELAEYAHGHDGPQGEEGDP